MEASSHNVDAATDATAGFALTELEAEAKRVGRELARIAVEMAESKAPFRVILRIPNTLVANARVFRWREGYDPSSFPASVKTLFEQCQNDGLRPILLGPSGRPAITVFGEYELMIRYDDSVQPA